MNNSLVFKLLAGYFSTVKKYDILQFVGNCFVLIQDFVGFIVLSKFKDLIKIEEIEMIIISDKIRNLIIQI